LPFAKVEGVIQQLLGSDKPTERLIGLAGFAVHRRDPGQPLVRALTDSDLRLRGRALKACGELGKTGLLQKILQSISVADTACRFYASWSAARLGDRSAQLVTVLRDLAMQPNSHAERALDMALRVMDLNDAKAWHSQLKSDPSRLRLAAIAAGIIGDPALVEGRIEVMKLPSVARAAGAAFSMITGVDLAYDDLDADAPEGFEVGPKENPEDENVALDPDENLRWPGPDLVSTWWKKNGNKFAAGKRHLCGKEISDASLWETLAKGYQPQRGAAALELALRQPTQHLFEVRANGGQQVRELKS